MIRPRVADLQPWVSAGILTESGWPGAWMSQVVCGPDDARSFDDDGSPDAYELCEACPVAAECLAYAVVTDNQEGLLGGLTSAERADLTHLQFPGQPDVLVTLGPPRVLRQKDTLDPMVERLLQRNLNTGQIAAQLGVHRTTVQKAARRIRIAAEAAGADSEAA